MKIALSLLWILLAQVLSKLLIYHPKRLREKINSLTGEIGSSLANFGNIPYGHSFVGRVWYDPDNKYGCNDFDIKITGEGDPDAEPSPMVIVFRGECPFTKKVRNIEHAGGSLGIIVDNNPGEKADQIIMVDDGTGNGINIPSMLISETDGKIIVDELIKCNLNKDISCVQLVARFELPNPDNRVEYDLWYTSSSDKALDFIKNFGELHNKFGKDVLFTPRVLSWGCQKCSEDIRQKHCFWEGKYCAVHFGNLNHTGHEILYENLREKCLHQILIKKEDDSQWWEYMRQVHASCRDDISEDCSKQAMSKLSLPYDQVNDCVQASFTSKDHLFGDNSILGEELKDWKEKGPHFFPAIIINNATYRGFLQPDHVFDALCKGFKEPPAECGGMVSGTFHVTEGLSLTLVIAIIFWVIACNVVLLLVYRNYQKREMAREIRVTASAAVSQYFALSTVDKDPVNRMREL